jgi:hypothetical protein
VLKPQSEKMRTLTTMVEQRRRLVNEQGRTTNRLRCALKQYYPQVLEWFEHIDTPLFCAFVKRWPTLTQAKRARANTLKRFFHEYHSTVKVFSIIVAKRSTVQDHSHWIMP